MPGHQLERLSPREWRCSRCIWSWIRPPASPCPGVPRFAGWQAVPSHLKTKTQLRQVGQIRGCVASRSVWYWLYDLADAVPVKRATETQRLALAKGRETQQRRREEHERAELE